MTLKYRDSHWFGDSQDDIRSELLRYSTLNGYPAEQFADARCSCGSQLFRLRIDDAAGVAVRRCDQCGRQQPMGDSGDFLEEAQPEECACPCESETFEITVGVSLYSDSDYVRWLYVGCRCSNCGLTACYGDWKNEFEGYQELLRRI